ncbi:MAG: 30S ribosomal protein S16 [Chloroflexi bacterium]|nr:30S ribosomal protein S16 [Chloroflexota bacterium]
MLRIRLSRVGKKKQPSYRLVVADSRAPRDGAFIEIIGHYNPRTDPTTLVVKEDEAVEWLSRGAQPSDTVAKLLTRIGVMERAGRAPVVWDRKTPVKPKKAAAEEAPAAAPAAAASAVDVLSEAAPTASANAAAVSGACPRCLPVGVIWKIQDSDLSIMSGVSAPSEAARRLPSRPSARFTSIAEAVWAIGSMA